MKIFVPLLLLLSLVSTVLSAQDLPEYCKGDARFRDDLQAMGPVITVGASVSSGLLARPFATLVAEQMCLEEGVDYEARYSFLFFGAKLSFLKKMYIERRPKIVIALDHLYHSSKSKKYDEVTRAYIDREVARISLDCGHAVIDCAPGGEFHFVREENYRPIVLLGDVYAPYAEDCSETNPGQSSRKNDRKRHSIENRERGCIDDYLKINRYMQQKAGEIPNLYLFPVSAFFQHLHRGLPFLYDLDDRLVNFYTDDLFWDGFHPWSEPGSQVMANIVLARLNQLILNGEMPGEVTIPYIPISEKFQDPFTGIVLINDTQTTIGLAGDRHFVTEQGMEFRFTFSAQSQAFRKQHGDWGYANFFSRDAGALVTRAGTNPLVLIVTQLSTNGEIILSDKQVSVIERVIADPRNRLLGGVITVTE